MEKKKEKQKIKGKRKPIKRLLVILREYGEARSQKEYRAQEWADNKKNRNKCRQPTYRAIQPGLASGIVVCQNSKVRMGMPACNGNCCFTFHVLNTISFESSELTRIILSRIIQQLVSKKKGNYSCHHLFPWPLWLAVSPRCDQRQQNQALSCGWLKIRSIFPGCLGHGSRWKHWGKVRSVSTWRFMSLSWAFPLSS